MCQHLHSVVLFDSLSLRLFKMLFFPFSKSCPTAKPVFSNLHSSLSDSFSGSQSFSFNPQTGFNLRPKSLQIRAMEASLDYHFGTQLQTHIKTPTSLKIAIIGFDNFDQFLAKTFVSQGHTVLAHSRSNYSNTAAKLGISFFSDPHNLCEEHPKVVMLCTLILSTKSVLKSIPFHRLRRSTLFVDALSVKEFPRSLFLEILPEEFDILYTHPMFGPESGKNGWVGLTFTCDKVRIGNDDPRISRCGRFLDVFARERVQNGRDELCV